MGDDEEEKKISNDGGDPEKDDTNKDGAVTASSSSNKRKADEIEVEEEDDNNKEEDGQEISSRENTTKKMKVDNDEAEPEKTKEEESNTAATSSDEKGIDDGEGGDDKKGNDDGGDKQSTDEKKNGESPAREEKEEKEEKSPDEKKDTKDEGGKKDIVMGTSSAAATTSDDKDGEDKMETENDKNDDNDNKNEGEAKQNAATENTNTEDSDETETKQTATENDEERGDKHEDKKNNEEKLNVGRGGKCGIAKAEALLAPGGGSEEATKAPRPPTKRDVDYVESDKNPYDALKFIVVENDGRPESLIKLVALKSLFSKQLPKMPRTYIARLVFDRRHTSIAILSEDPALKDTDEEVIGSICYRAFPEMRFAEIAFCAVNATHQVKGYGTKLMNLLKREGARTGIEYFITYADNYAIGYFKKQGFTKNISMPKGRYMGLIKDYDGGTMMECYVHPSIDFTRIPEMLAAQRKFILDRIRAKGSSTKVYEPLPKNFSPNMEGVSRANESAARAMAIPGMMAAGWTMNDLMVATGQGREMDKAKNALKSDLLQMIRKVEEQQFAWPFREPVDTNEVKDYLDVIKEPIDLSTIDKRIRKGDHYKSKQMLYADLMLMINNCKLYNDEASTYVQCAIGLEKFLGTFFLSAKS